MLGKTVATAAKVRAAGGVVVHVPSLLKELADLESRSGPEAVRDSSWVHGALGSLGHH